MSSVTIKSHPDMLYTGRSSMVIPTNIAQPTIMKKAAFHLLNNTNSNLNTVISNGEFTAYEMSLLNLEKVTIFSLRTSFILDNIDLFREEFVPDNSQIFILPVFLQEKRIKICKLLFGISLFTNK